MIVIINSSLNLYINIYISGISSSIMYNNIILIIINNKIIYFNFVVVVHVNVNVVVVVPIHPPPIISNILRCQRRLMYMKKIQHLLSPPLLRAQTIVTNQIFFA